MNHMHSIPHSDPYMTRSPANYSPSDMNKSKAAQYIPSSDMYDDYGAQDYVNGPPNGVPRKFYKFLFLNRFDDIYSVVPRSASESIVDVGTKYRQLPCRTFISVGTCPYRERCVYLHDPRCICREAKTKTRRKNKDDVVLDSMFWPIMTFNSVSAKLDNNRQPHVIQPYNVPPPQNDQFRRHDEAVYSMWMHFVDFCLANSESQHAPYPDLAPCFAAPDLPMNAYTKLPRLPVFRVLSAANGNEISVEEIAAAELGNPETSSHIEFAAKSALRQISSGAYRNTNPDVFTHVSPDSAHPTGLTVRVSSDMSELDNVSADSRRSSLNDGTPNTQVKEIEGRGRPESHQSLEQQFSPDAITMLFKQRTSSGNPSKPGFSSLAAALSTSLFV